MLEWGEPHKLCYHGILAHAIWLPCHVWSFSFFNICWCSSNGILHKICYRKYALEVLSLKSNLTNSNHSVLISRIQYVLLCLTTSPKRYSLHTKLQPFPLYFSLYHYFLLYLTTPCKKVLPTYKTLSIHYSYPDSIYISNSFI
jgi:hypothetical protein